MTKALPRSVRVAKMLESAPHGDLSPPPLLRPVKRQKRLIQEPSEPLESDKLRQQGYRLDGHQRLVDIIDDPVKIKQGSPEWFEARKNKITSSIADTILDNNSFQTYWQLVNERAGVTVPDAEWIPVKKDGVIEYMNPNRPEIYTGSNRNHKDLLKRRNYLEREAWPREENVVYVVLDIEHTGGIGARLSSMILLNQLLH